MSLSITPPLRSLPRPLWGGSQRFKETLDALGQHLLGVLAYSADSPQWPPGAYARAWVPLPVLDGPSSWYLIWVSPSTVVFESRDGIDSAADGTCLFGTMRLDESDPTALEDRTRRAYDALFDRLDATGYPHLLRVWNYLPDINGAGRLHERYREFNIGRHEAFQDRGRPICQGVVPAACALGTRQGPGLIAFLASRTPGQALENPRQTQAYHYPPSYGPRSPTFSRGLLLGDGLLVSGTASVVGAESVHCGDMPTQLEETVTNLRAVVDQARRGGFCPPPESTPILVTYLRQGELLEQIRPALVDAFPGSPTVFLEADICRTDLALEIEAFWIPP